MSNINLIEFVKLKKQLKAENPNLSNDEINELAKASTPSAPKSEPVMNVKDTIAAIKQIESIDELNTLSINEKRKTVLEAITKQITQIKNK